SWAANTEASSSSSRANSGTFLRSWIVQAMGTSHASGPGADASTLARQPRDGTGGPDAIIRPMLEGRAPSPIRIAFLALLAGLSCSWAGAGPPTPFHQRWREILRELIETDTTHEHGSTTKAAEKMARRLRDAGFPAADVQVIGPSGSPNANLVARMRGRGRGKPVLLLAHLDVVEARREDWTFDP